MNTRSGYGHQLEAADPALTVVNLPPAEESTRFLISRDAAGHLQVLDAMFSKRGALRIDFSNAEMRRRIAAGRKQPLSRACGLHKRTDLNIVDATAGLGRDGYCLAALGAQVTLHERHPVLFALLYDALERADTQVCERLRLLPHDSRLTDWPEADVIYLDPMFPHQGRRAAPGLDMQYLQAMVGADEDADQLWQHAESSQAARLVLKRPPRGANVRMAPPDASFGGGRAVYEVYIRPHLASKSPNAT